MKILVLNCGSSSIKFELFSMKEEKVLSKGVVEKVGMKGSFLRLEKQDGNKVRFNGDVLDHKTGVEYILGVLSSKKHGALKSLNEIQAVGHRVVHGGEYFSRSVFINEEVIKVLEKNVELAPLHNPANLRGIYALQELIPDVPQVAVFDTAFHQTMKPNVYMYGIPYALYKKYKIRRYGFHGTSHRYVSARAVELLNTKTEGLKIISCHLGNGASIAAVKDGISVDTSMGFTPVEGLIMGTRSGDLDIGALTYIMRKEEIGIETSSVLVNKFSGMLGITGVSSDMREIEEKADEGNKRAILGLEMYAYRVKKYIGSYAAALGGVDVLIFTGGIGENAVDIRKNICEGLEFAGIVLDEEKNNSRGKEKIISSEKSKTKIMIIPTNEELVIAQDTYKIVQTLN
ncbi:MAG: acetate kinase [Bacteroidales bacterium]|nr:acetate kinase [Bacteroidales bacterium]